MKFDRVFIGAAVSALVVAAAGQASAQSTITNAAGTVTVGIGADGELYNNDAGVGLRRESDNYDPIAPGTPRDSWGISSSLGFAVADGNSFGSTNVSTTFVAGANSATYTTSTTVGFDVVQNFSFVGDGNILRIDTAVTNVSGGALDGLFQRNVDWDIDPTAFDELVFGPSGSSSLVVDSTYYGFEDPNPAQAYGFSCLGGCDVGPGDLGAGIKINFGTLVSGATARFSYFYGINVPGQSVNTLIGQGHAVGAAYLIAGTSSDGNRDRPASNSAFIGVSTAAVPEPATWAMMILGFFGLGSMVRRRRAVAA